MEKLLSNPKLTAFVGFILCLPGIIIFSLLLLHIDPNFGPLKPWLNPTNHSKPNFIGTLVALTTILLLPSISLVFNLIAVKKSLWAGNKLSDHSVNIAVVAIVITILVVFVGGIIVDQYPCWAGIPNCD